MENVHITLLYSIKTDDAQDFTLDKIDFLNKTTQQFFAQIKEDQFLQVKGLFGTHLEVEREVEQEIKQKVNLQSFVNYSEKGNVIAIKLQNLILFCLILSEKFFISKPINEKAIEIVLFRILQDLTDNIKFCLNDTILKHNWDQGDVIPFSRKRLNRNDYDVTDEQNKEVKLYDCNWILSQEISNKEIINSQTLSPIINALKINTFEKDRFQKSYDQFTQKLIIQILSTQNKEINNLITIIQKEYQTKSLIDMLNKLAQQLQEEVNKAKEDLLKSLQKNKNLNNKQCINDIEARLNNIWQTVSYENDKISYKLNHAHQNQQEPFQICFKVLTEKLNKTCEIFRNCLNQIEELNNQTYYEIQSVSLKLERHDNDKSEQVERILQKEFKKYTFSKELIQIKDHSQFLITNVFQTKEKSNIFIISINPYKINQQNPGKTCVFFQSQFANQPKPIKQFDQKDTQNAVYFHDYNRGHLYIFNFKDNFVFQIIITETGQIKSEHSIYQQENNNYFCVSQVAYLHSYNKFIVLSKDNKVYKQLDQGQDFENVKCIEQFENGTKKKDFLPSIQSQYKYTQLLSCPSGKYFYLANHYCCDRYDLNCMRIQSIPIQGPIKIFGDNQDVIILCQLYEEKQQKKAIIISNIVSFKTFNKLQNNEQKVMGNPALDIAKGSFIKFGPNSQFLLNEKKRNINIYVDKDYQNQIEKYLNIMNVNEIILSSQMCQYAEFTCESIKNLVYSRVPLQLCTIENSNLIPLKDGFRQQTQTQTIISVDQKVKQLHLGFLEEHFQNYNKKIFVVGIIGKQSSGKSYLLNRVFGTRFSVSSARCTDGVWASIAYENDKTFLILDCEGLFNGARTDKEEIKMLAFLTAICDITILNSDLTFNRHFNDLFNHLVDASKQLKGEKLFQGILYFVLRDVSSTDNLGAEQELLKNLERLKESGSDDIIFLKTLFNNKMSVEKLVNYENFQFDEQIIEVRKYFFDNFSKSIRWKDGQELIYIMKILLCQLELSDHSNATLIELQIRIEKMVEKNKEIWYEFTLNEDKYQNLKLSPSKYKFEKFQDHYYILRNKDLLKQMYEDLGNEDSIQTHNKNLQNAIIQFNQMMQFRKDQIISRTQYELSSIQNQEVQIMIQNQMSMLQNFLTDQMKLYEFCLEKCNKCHLFCKQFKNHIEISEKLTEVLNDQITKLENEHKNLQITNKDQFKEKRKRIDDIDDEIKETENNLEGLKIYYHINEIKEKQNQIKIEMMNYEFYKKDDNTLSFSFFAINQEDIGQPQILSLDNIEELQDKISELSLELQRKNDENMKIIKQQEEQIENYHREQNIQQQSIGQIQINKEKQQEELKRVKEQQERISSNMEKIQSQINDIVLLPQEYQFDIEQEKEKLEEITNQLIEQKKKVEEKTAELEQLQQTNVNEYFNNLNTQFEQYEQQSSKLRQEIQNLKNNKRRLEDLREQIKDQQSKKGRPNKQLIEELTQELNEINEQEVNNQLSQFQQKKDELENENETDCQEVIVKEQNSIQSEDQENSEQEKIIQRESENDKTLSAKESDHTYKQNVVNLFLQKKKEQLIEINNQISSLEKEIQVIKNSIEQYTQNIEKLTTKNKLLDTQKALQSESIDIDSTQQNIIIELTNLETDRDEKIKNIELLKLQVKQFQDKNSQIDLQINKLNSKLDQIKEFSNHFNEYQVQSQMLKEKQTELEKIEDFDQFQNLEQSLIQTYIEQFQQKFHKFQEEKEQLMNQLKTFNQIEIDRQHLKDLKDKKQKLVELELNVHSCQRDSHKCDQICQQCPNEICDNKAGHDEQQEHLCNKQNHRCTELCQIIQCQSNCMRSFRHYGKHNCGNKHPCMKNCSYCDKICKKDRSDFNHGTHDCLDRYCNQNCKLCSRKCSEPHKHSLQKYNHFCECVHYCQELCQEEGICKIEYEQIEETWKTQSSEFKYTKNLPKVNGKQKCQKQIPAKTKKHGGIHCCKEKTERQFHNCDKQCPECNTYCDKQYGHKGLHSSDRHRNKEKQIFTIQEGIQVQMLNIENLKEQSIRQYQIGESSEPETCDLSCKRRGRAHYHLVKCEGGKKCLGKKCGYNVRHSYEKYIGFEQFKFDEVLCQDFWKLMNWDHPILNELETINKCNYYCPLCEQEKNSYSFCNDYAWHTKDDKISAHSFTCREQHLKNQIQGINIAFVIDTTKSMKSFLNNCKDVIKKIIQKNKAHKNAQGEELDVQFAVVSYSDHSIIYKQSEEILKIQDFTQDNTAISFLDSLELIYSLDHPEAVLDGLNASIKLKWNKNYEKLLYLIADAPPHGRRYNNYSDNHPKGCPCGLKQEDIFKELKDQKVKFKILKLNQDIDMMISEFKKDFEELVVITPDIKDENDFQNKIVDDVCQCLTINEFTYSKQKQK